MQVVLRGTSRKKKKLGRSQYIERNRFTTVVHPMFVSRLFTTVCPERASRDGVTLLHGAERTATCRVNLVLTTAVDGVGSGGIWSVVGPGTGPAQVGRSDRRLSTRFINE